MEELNKKIAVWLGWEFASNGKKYRLSPEASGWGRIDLLPKFTESLDACFKYIVPKLESYMIKQNIWGTEHHCWIMFGGKPATSSEETPALAFCKAVEKLIDDIT
ncbi:unnamed protein product [marine sediment metagenome]|uniref:Phage ABA sandwich domain-containing protein n=1 Tax=marine sediment metagenome TaxID=412755 RepID=X1QMD2_9ZZZZ